MRLWNELARELVGGRPHFSGSSLESIYQSVFSPGRVNEGEGFNPNVTDVGDTNSIAYQFRVFLVVGYNTGKGVADAAAATINSPTKSCGDRE